MSKTEVERIVRKNADSLGISDDALIKLISSSIYDFITSATFERELAKTVVDGIRDYDRIHGH